MSICRRDEKDVVWIQENTVVISLLLFLSVSFRDLACNKLAYASVVLTNVYKLLEEQSVSSTTWHGLGRKDELLTSCFFCTGNSSIVSTLQFPLHLRSGSINQCQFRSDSVRMADWRLMSFSTPVVMVRSWINNPYRPIPQKGILNDGGMTTLH